MAQSDLTGGIHCNVTLCQYYKRSGGGMTCKMGYTLPHNIREGVRQIKEHGLNSLCPFIQDDKRMAMLNMITFNQLEKNKTPTNQTEDSWLKLLCKIIPVKIRNQMMREIIMKSIKEILMHRDNMTAEEADDLIELAREELNMHLEEGNIQMAEEVCADYFGLEPDYLDQLM